MSLIVTYHNYWPMILLPNRELMQANLRFDSVVIPLKSIAKQEWESRVVQCGTLL